MKLAIIPARGGSKRIPRKNGKSFHGKPMLIRAIELAVSSGLFERIVVSTDDGELRQLAQRTGAATVIDRPTELADDSTPTQPVIAHAVLACEAKGWTLDEVCCIYPCCPFLTESDLREGLSVLRKAGTGFVFPVTEYPHPVQRAMRRTDTGQLSFFSPEHELARSQDLEPAFHDLGQYYWGSAEMWKGSANMHSSGRGVFVPRWRFVDIDTMDDWRRAELLYAVMRAGHE